MKHLMKKIDEWLSEILVVMLVVFTGLILCIWLQKTTSQKEAKEKTETTKIGEETKEEIEIEKKEPKKEEESKEELTEKPVSKSMETDIEVIVQRVSVKVENLIKKYFTKEGKVDVKDFLEKLIPWVEAQNWPKDIKEEIKSAYKEMLN